MSSIRSIEEEADGSRSVTTLFIRKAYKLVSGCASEFGGWNTEGTSICIRNPEAFAQYEIPKMYSHSKYASFVRQLHVYGFTKSRVDKTGATALFTHPLFKRGRPDLLPLMKRDSTSTTPTTSEATCAQPVADSTRRATLEMLQKRMEAMRISNATMETQVTELYTKKSSMLANGECYGLSPKVQQVPLSSPILLRHPLIIGWRNFLISCSDLR